MLVLAVSGIDVILWVYGGESMFTGLLFMQITSSFVLYLTEKRVTTIIVLIIRFLTFYALHIESLTNIIKNYDADHLALRIYFLTMFSAIFNAIFCMGLSADVKNYSNATMKSKLTKE